MPDTLNAIAKLAADPQMTQRVAAAIAQEHEYGTPTPPPEEAEGTAWAKRYAWAATPTWAEKYQYAIDTGVENPGTDPGVIPDADISAWVQSEWPAPTEEGAQ